MRSFSAGRLAVGSRRGSTFSKNVRRRNFSLSHFRQFRPRNGSRREISGRNFRVPELYAQKFVGERFSVVFFHHKILDRTSSSVRSELKALGIPLP